jgi:hypothetical protein
MSQVAYTILSNDIGKPIGLAHFFDHCLHFNEYPLKMFFLLGDDAQCAQRSLEDGLQRLSGRGFRHNPADALKA